MKNEFITLGDLITTAQYYGIGRDVPLFVAIDDGETQHVARVAELQRAKGGGEALFLCADFNPNQTITALSVNAANAFRTGQK